MALAKDGSQTSNSYYFSELGPVAASSGTWANPARSKRGSTSDNRGGREEEWTGPDKDRDGDCLRSQGVNRDLSSIEECKEASPPDAGGNHPPTPLNEGGVENESEELVNAWSAVCCVLKSELSSTACFTDFTDEYDRYFRDTWQVGVIGDRMVIRGGEAGRSHRPECEYEKRMEDSEESIRLGDHGTRCGDD